MQILSFCHFLHILLDNLRYSFNPFTSWAFNYECHSMKLMCTLLVINFNGKNSLSFSKNDVKKQAHNNQGNSDSKQNCIHHQKNSRGVDFSDFSAIYWDISLEEKEGRRNNIQQHNILQSEAVQEDVKKGIPGHVVTLFSLGK